jgi:hypothetical protein
MTAALAIAAIVAAAAVVLAALPFLRDPSPAADRLERQDELERRALELAEERDRALAALKELEFDHRTGKISDEDYRRLVGPLRIRAAQTLRALEPEIPEPPAPEPPQPPPSPAPTTPEPVPEPYPPDEITPPAPPLVPEPGPRN